MQLKEVVVEFVVKTNEPNNAVIDFILAELDKRYGHTNVMWRQRPTNTKEIKCAGT
jgi:hypothetical protein